METQNRTSGTLTTKPLILKGKELRVNCDASGSKINVEVLDVDGTVLQGFSKEACKGIRGDEIAARVEWEGSEFSSLDQKPIKLRFHMDNARLYSFVALV
jgi:hypothetical protein